MIIDKENPSYGTIVKLGPTIEAEYPKSSAGENPHCGRVSIKPIVGKSFLMVTENGWFKTSFIKKIISESDNIVRFETNNSVYQLSINLFADID